MKSLAILSHKGGVGKTMIAVNIASYLAKQGKNVCLFDNDFHGPSLYTYFEKSDDVEWVNNYLMGEKSIENCLENFCDTLAISGNLWVAFADPTPESIQNIIRVDRNSSMQMLRKLLQLKKKLQGDPYNIDYLIIDSSPGTGFATVNVMVMTEASLFIIKISNADIIGTSKMISGLYTQLKSRSLVLANYIPVSALKRQEEIEQLIVEQFSKDLGSKIVEFLGWIPIDYQLQEIELETAIGMLSDKKFKRLIFTLEKPDHIYSQTIKELIPRFFGEDSV